MRDIDIGKVKEIVFDFMVDKRIIAKIIPEAGDFAETLKLHIYGNPKIIFNSNCDIESEKDVPNE
jgi:hypothetical protein